MKPTSRLIFLFAALLGPGARLAAQTPTLLEPKVERHQGPPLWIAADRVADEEKIVDLDLVGSDSLRRRVEKQRQTLGDRMASETSRAAGKPSVSTVPLAECKSTSYLEDDRGGAAPSATLSDLVTHSRSIIQGTVATIDLGFAFGSPSSLLGVEVTEVIKGPAPRSPFYVDYPVARFKIGPLYFCNTTQGFEPRPGDKILLFDYTGPRDRDDVLYAPRLDQLFFESQDGPLFLPPGLRDTELGKAQTLRDILRRIGTEATPDSRRGER